MSKLFQRISLALALALSSAAVLTNPASVARAQNNLSYGDIVQGELTEDVQEIKYTFDGDASDLVIVQLIPRDNEDGYSPRIKVLMHAPDDEQLIDTSANYGKRITGTSAITFMEVLSANGTYTITVAADNEGTVGPFELQLWQPEKLVLDETISAEGTYQGYSRYLGFYVVSAAEDISLLLEVMEGKGLALAVEEFLYGYMIRRANVDGVAVKAVELLVSAGEADYYIVTVASPGYSSKETTVSYKLTARAGG